MARFVLLHGAWLGGWCWEPLVRELEARGHAVEAPDLPCEDVEAGVGEYAAAIGPQTESVVVAHSLGGLTLPLVEARLAVFLAAFVPVADVYAVALDPGFGGTARDELGRSYWPDEETAAARLWPDVDAETARRSFPRLRRQAPLRPVELLPGGPSAYVLTRRDISVRPEWQAEAARDLLGVEPVELDAGHFAMLTHARELAGILERLA